VSVEIEINALILRKSISVSANTTITMIVNPSNTAIRVMSSPSMLSLGILFSLCVFNIGSVPALVDYLINLDHTGI
jgi:hypothetical protein